MNLLLKDIARNGNDGIGKPEPLRHRDGWSRRIDDTNRLVYQLKDDGSMKSCSARGITTNKSIWYDGSFAKRRIIKNDMLYF